MANSWESLSEQVMVVLLGPRAWVAGRASVESRHSRGRGPATPAAAPSGNAG